MTAIETFMCCLLIAMERIVNLTYSCAVRWDSLAVKHSSELLFARNRQSLVRRRKLALPFARRFVLSYSFSLLHLHTQERHLQDLLRHADYRSLSDEPSFV